ncbi:MAG: ribosome-associated protein [Granulosicoccus sp.]|jgi:ribosome-associated protein
MNNHIENKDDDYITSRTEQKKSMQIYVKIGEQLLELSKKQLDTIPLNSEINDAVNVAKKISVGNALKRQLSFLAKLIRKGEHEEIQAALDNLHQKDSLHDKISKKAEQWRDRILAEELNVLSDFMTRYNSTERQKLGQVARHAIKENKLQLAEKQTTDKITTSSKYKKQLFILLRSEINE